MASTEHECDARVFNLLLSTAAISNLQPAVYSTCGDHPPAAQSRRASNGSGSLIRTRRKSTCSIGRSRFDEAVEAARISTTALVNSDIEAIEAFNVEWEAKMTHSRAPRNEAGFTAEVKPRTKGDLEAFNKATETASLSMGHCKVVDVSRVYAFTGVPVDELTLDVSISSWSF